MHGYEFVTSVQMRESEIDYERDVSNKTEAGRVKLRITLKCYVIGVTFSSYRGNFIRRQGCCYKVLG
jgi:hypothetical protein